MSDTAMIIEPEEIPELGRAWRDEHLARERPARRPSLLARLHDRLRLRTFRELGRGYTPGTRTAPSGLIDGSKVRRILLVRYDAVGDYICSTGLITWLRAALPHAEIDMITSPRNDPVARIDPNIRRTYPIDYQFRKVRPEKLAALHEAAANDYDVAIGMLEVRMTKLARVIAMVAPGAEKVCWYHAARLHIYGQVFKWHVTREEWREHFVNVFTRLASETIEPVAPAPELPVMPYIVIGEEAWRAAEAFMRSEGLGFGGFAERTVLGKGWSGPRPEAFEGAAYTVVNISAFVKARQWSPVIAAEVCRGLLERHPDRLIYVTGAPKEHAEIATVVQRVADVRCRHLRLKLPEFFCFVGGASLVVSPDTATIHIAAAHRRPVVGLYCERIKVVEWYPMGTRFTVVLSPDRDTVNAIRPGEVLEAVERLESRMTR